MPNCCLDCAANAHYRSLFYHGGLRHERLLSFTVLSRGTAPRTPKTLRCSASERGQFVARTRGAVFAGNEYALFFANCPLHTCRAGACPRRCLPLNRCRFAAFCLALVDGFDLFPSFALFAQIDSTYRCFAVPRCERLCPSRSPQACWREA